MPVELNLVESVTELDTTVVTVILESASEPGPAGAGVASGGTIGQVLTKDSSTDFDTSWQDATGGGSGVTDADYLVGTAHAGLSAEIVVGTSPGGELGNTWASPTVDATHSGSSHADVQAAAEATAAGALSTHSADTTGVHGITDTSALALTANVQPIDSDLTAIAALTTTAFGRGLLELANQAALLSAAGAAAASHAHAGEDITSGTVADARIASTIARDSEVTSAISALSSVYQPLDSDLTAIAALTTTSYGLALLTQANEAAFKATVNLEANTDFYAPAGTDVALADGGTGASLTDPNADRIMFWDDSAGAVDWLTAGSGLAITGTSIATTGGAGLHSGYALLQDQKAANTQSGTFTAGSFQTRVLNTEVFDVGGIVTLSSNQFTLAAGTYLIKARAPVFGVDRHQCKIRNVTDSSDAIIGSSSYAANANAGTEPSFVTGRITIAGSKAFELQHYCETTRSNQGFGVEANRGVIEVYAEVEIWKEA